MVRNLFDGIIVQRDVKAVNFAVRERMSAIPLEGVIPMEGPDNVPVIHEPPPSTL
jgi:hypothetical protein